MVRVKRETVMSWYMQHQVNQEKIMENAKWHAKCCTTIIHDKCCHTNKPPPNACSQCPTKAAGITGEMFNNCKSLDEFYNIFHDNIDLLSCTRSVLWHLNVAITSVARRCACQTHRGPRGPATSIPSTHYQSTVHVTIPIPFKYAG